MSNTTSNDAYQMMQRFVAILPHARALGLRVEAAAPATVTMAMPYDVRLIGDPESRVVHGGAVSALLDTTCGGAVTCHPAIAGVSTATLDLRIDYMRAATPGQTILARATCFHVTRTVAFVRAEAWTADDADRLVASATGAFTAPDRAPTPQLAEG